jgi:thiol-disulfide isomerase/thioredoxin
LPEKNESTNTITLPDEVVKHEGYEIEVYDYESFEPLLKKDNDTLYIINFWASWCKPCVKEMPYFEQIGERFGDEKLKILLVSLDFRNQLESKLIPFIRENNISSKVIMLNDPDANSWIGKVDEEWTGSIPATIFYKGEKRTFYEKAFEYSELEDIVKSFL